jgi:uncharacterized membrane protein YqjE
MPSSDYYPRTGGFFESLKALGSTAIDIVHTRLELLVTEIAEEQANLMELLLIAALSLLCFFLGVVFVAFFVVVAFWETPYRMLATGLIAAALFIAAIALWVVFRNKGKEKTRLFGSTLREMAIDRDLLR